jgi:hypothetical protein
MVTRDGEARHGKISERARLCTVASSFSSSLCASLLVPGQNVPAEVPLGVEAADWLCDEQFLPSLCHECQERRRHSTSPATTASTPSNRRQQVQQQSISDMAVDAVDCGPAAAGLLEPHTHLRAFP